MQNFLDYDWLDEGKDIAPSGIESGFKTGT